MNDTLSISDIEIQKPEWDGRSYNWDPDLEMEITRTFAGEVTPGTTDRESAVAYVQQRFGCVYKALPEEFQRDIEIAYIAACQSAGHTLKDAPAEIRESFGPEFYIAAIRNGVRPWILNYISRTDVLESDEVAKEIRIVLERDQKELVEMRERDQK